MEPSVYQRKWETLSRAFIRLSEYYLGKIDPRDSINGPKDFVYAYFHATYSLKESLKGLRKNDNKIDPVETFIMECPCVALGIDISNAEKHGELKDSKSGKVIGKVNSHIHVFDPSGKDRTELTIEVGEAKIDCLELATENFNAWKNFMNNNDLIFQ